MTPFDVCCGWCYFLLLSAHRSPSLVWDIESPAFKTNDAFPNLKPFCRIKHNCQTVRNEYIWLLKWLIFFILGEMVNDLASSVESKSRCLSTFHSRLQSFVQCSEDADTLQGGQYEPFTGYLFQQGTCDDFYYFACSTCHQGNLITQLSDQTMISAVQAVTCSHPSIIERAASGNASGRCVLWAPESLMVHS